MNGQISYKGILQTLRQPPTKLKKKKVFKKDMNGMLKQEKNGNH